MCFGAKTGPKKKIVVVGAGYVGSAVAKDLDKNYDVVVIEPQDALHHKIAALRGAVIPGWERRVRVPLTNLLVNGKIVQSTVVEVTSNSVSVRGNDGVTTEITADYVVLAHGMGNMMFPCGPLTGETRSEAVIQSLREKQAQIKSAKSIVIVGGGPVGVEMAGEIKSFYPDKKVTLIHSSSALLNNSTPALYPPALERLKNLLVEVGCDVKLGVRLTSLPSASGGDGIIGDGSLQTYTLTDNTTIDADLIILANGGVRQGDPIVPPEALNDKGQVIVDDYFRVQGFQNVFCVGDANNVAETKMAYTGDLQAKHLVKVISAMVNGKPPAPYRLSSQGKQYGAMFVPVGPKKGVGAMNTSVMGNFPLRIIKGKGLFSKAQFSHKNATLPDAPAV